MLTVTIAGLRAVEALATHGSITAAAAALGYTPSAISQQITRLERDIRQTLIERQGRRATLTLAGRTLAESATRIVMELESLNTELQAQAQTVNGRLTIAAFPTAARGVIPATMQELRQRWADLDLQLIEVDSHRAVDLVARGAVDLGVAHDWLEMPLSLPDGLDARRIGSDISDVLLPCAHPLADREEVDLDEVLEESWLYEPGSVAHDFLINAYQRSPKPARFAHMVTEYSTQVAMVGAGLGVALVPRMGRGPLPPAVRSIRVRSAPERQIYGVWRTAVGRRPAISVALDALAATCERRGDGARI